jgi:hypothetical protein
MRLFTSHSTRARIGEVLFEVERSQSRYEVAETLRGAADELEADESLTLSAGSEDRT